jgi:hypothetical protein
MHDCPECGMACDCDGEDTWVGWPANIDCSHDCEEEWDRDDDQFDDDCEDEAWVEIQQPTLWQHITRFFNRFKPYRCDVCGKWTFLNKYDPCCSNKCMSEWVPF